MIFPNEEKIEALREEYPAGCRVRLLQMDDKYAPPVGTEGVCQGVDDCGSVLVNWQNGSSLSVIYGVDRIEKIG